MKITDSHLRSMVRNELYKKALNEQEAVATGGNVSAYNNQQKQQIADKVQKALQDKLKDVLLPGSSWALTVNIGKDGVSVGKKSGSIKGVRNREIRPHLKDIANDTSIINRKLLKRHRRLKISVSNTTSKTEELSGPIPPDESDKPKPPPTTIIGRGPCVKLQQKEMIGQGWTGRADGIWGPRTQAAWDKYHTGETRPADLKDLPACKDKDEELDLKCPPGMIDTGTPGKPDCVKDEENPCLPYSEEVKEFFLTGGESMGVYNVLLEFNFYKDMINAPTALTRYYADIFNWSVVDESKKTVELMKKLVKCCPDEDASPDYHQRVAKELIKQITANSWAFGNGWRPMALFDIVAKMGVWTFYKWISDFWNATNWFNYFDPLPSVHQITWSRAGFSGWIPGFDKVGSTNITNITFMAKKMDKLDWKCLGGSEEVEVEEEDELSLQEQTRQMLRVIY